MIFTAEDGLAYEWASPRDLGQGDIVIIPNRGTKHTVMGPGGPVATDAPAPMNVIPTADPSGRQFVPAGVYVLRAIREES